MATFRISVPAQRDVDQIWHYHATNASVEVSVRQIAILNESFQILSEQPYIGIARHEHAPDMRSHAVPRTQYIIFYFPTAYGVEIARVVDGRSDPSRWFD